MKRAAARNDPHAQALEALDGIVGRDGIDDVVDVIADGAVIDDGVQRQDAEFARGADLVRALCRGQQRLGGNAAVVQAVAAHLVLLDEHDALTEGSRGGSNRQAARTGADDAEVHVERLRATAPRLQRSGSYRASRPLQRFKAIGINATTPSRTNAASNSLVTSALVSMS